MVTSATQVEIGGYQFLCVRLSQADFSDISVVYVILCVQPNGDWIVLDVGESGEVGTRIGEHDREECWRRNCRSDNIWVCVYPMRGRSREERLAVEAELRQRYRPHCGTR